MSHNRTSSTLRARAALASHGAGNRRWLSSAEGGGASEKALSALSKAIEEGDDAAVQQLASSLSKKAAARLVEELSQQNKVNVVAGDDSKVVRVEDFVNIDRNADGVITSQEFERFIRESNEHKQVSEPTRSQLWMVALASSVPFVGFGFMDNAIMILAGEVIEAKVGVAFGLTTMAAAAIGNLISDVCGVGLGGTVEVVAAKFGCKQPALSTEQMQMRCTQLTSNMGAAVGVALGCFLGMFPLLFMKGREDEEDEEDAGAAHAHTHGHGPHGHGAHTHAHAHGSASK